MKMSFFILSKINSHENSGIQEQNAHRQSSGTNIYKKSWKPLKTEFSLEFSIFFLVLPKKPVINSYSSLLPPDLTLNLPQPILPTAYPWFLSYILIYINQNYLSFNLLKIIHSKTQNWFSIECSARHPQLFLFQVWELRKSMYIECTEKREWKKI